MPEQNKKILLHACCGICSAYPIKFLQDMGYEVIVYFYNPNIYPIEEYQKRLEAEKILCEHFDCRLIEGEYDSEEFYTLVKGLENEPEKGKRCDVCFELRLRKTAQMAESLNIEQFTTSIVISPHKKFDRLAEIGKNIAGERFLAIDFKKKDGFLNTNKISKELGLYRQNYCGCKYSMRTLCTNF